VPAWRPTLAGVLVVGALFVLAPAEAGAPTESFASSATVTTPAPMPVPSRVVSAPPSPAVVASPAPTPTTAANPVVTPKPAPSTQAAPPVPAGSGAGRRVVYSIGQQRVWLITGDGTVASTYPVSGRLSQPGPGSYRVYSRSRHARSAVSAATMEYMVRFAHGARTGAPIGFHDIPRRLDGSYEQSVADLGKPLSAGCIRQSSGDARRLWEFAPVGTAVVVVR
jgi:lipoprotein-anchoring transpeptidase ErfK/SrfK